MVGVKCKMQNLTVDDIKDVVAGALSNVLSHSSSSSTFRSTVREEPSPRPVPSVSSGGVDNRSIGHAAMLVADSNYQVMRKFLPCLLHYLLCRNTEGKTHIVCIKLVTYHKPR